MSRTLKYIIWTLVAVAVYGSAFLAGRWSKKIPIVAQEIDSTYKREIIRITEQRDLYKKRGDSLAAIPDAVITIKDTVLKYDTVYFSDDSWDAYVLEWNRATGQKWVDSVRTISTGYHKEN
ncbi:MAG: hypothetical protein ACRC3B_12985 [Bacteroidia bacterium]